MLAHFELAIGTLATTIALGLVLGDHRTNPMSTREVLEKVFAHRIGPVKSMKLYSVNSVTYGPVLSVGNHWINLVAIPSLCLVTPAPLQYSACSGACKYTTLSSFSNTF